MEEGFEYNDIFDEMELEELMLEYMTDEQAEEYIFKKYYLTK